MLRMSTSHPTTTCAPGAHPTPARDLFRVRSTGALACRLHAPGHPSAAEYIGDPYPPKVETVLRLLRAGGWTPTVEVDTARLSSGTFYWIRAEEYPGTLATSAVSTHVYYRQGKGRGVLGTSRYDSIGSHFEYHGWPGVRRLASWGPVR